MPGRNKRTRFPAGLIEALKTAGGSVKLLVACAFGILVVYWITHIPLALLIMLTALVVFLVKRDKEPESFLPSPDEVAEADDARTAAELAEWDESGEGDRLFEVLLTELHALQGVDVTVMLGEMGMTSGILGPGRNIADDLVNDELLFFQVGPVPGNGFHVDRDRFTAPGARIRRLDHAALELRDGTGAALIFYVNIVETSDDA